jgi:hypothetical protein
MVMKKKALFLGVNEYEDNQIRNLTCACSDAEALNSMFEELGYETYVLKNPKQDDVQNKLKEITKGMKKNDQFLFYFSGHGFSVQGKNLLFFNNHIYSELRFDMAGLPFNWLEDFTRKGGYDRIFILDACRSDFLTGGKGLTETKTFGNIGEMIPNEHECSSSGACYILRSCKEREQSFEIEELNHGLFTRALMNVIEQSKQKGKKLQFNDYLRIQIHHEMNNVVNKLQGHIAITQTPESKGDGVITQNLLDGDDPPINTYEELRNKSSNIKSSFSNAEPVHLYNRFISLLDTDELKEFKKQFLAIVPTDPNALNPREANTPRIINDEENLVKLFADIKRAYIAKKRQSFENKFWSCEAHRQNLSLTLRDMQNRNHLLNAMYECIELK